jgi:hypothetical protein
MGQDGKFSAPGRVTNDFRELAPIRQARLPWPLDRNGLKSPRLECGHTRALDSVVLRLSKFNRSGKDGSWNPFPLPAPKLWRYLSISGCQYYTENSSDS